MAQQDDSCESREKGHPSPAAGRLKAQLGEGDRVEVQARDAGLLLVRKVKSLKEVQKKMARRLPQWTELEGEADEVAQREATRR